ncbi:MAG: LCP family protein [Clostridiales bacterium]|nr:LCP family protein [Clostridiales bacterium]MDY4060770.1 LCP family protein [Anaerovoracaceae bacterium]
MEKPGRGRRKKMKLWQMILISILVIVMGVGIGAFIYANHMLDKLDKVDVNKDDLGMVDVDGYVNILIMGVDSRDMKHTKGSRTDAIILLSLEEKTNKVKLTSIYRDTMLKMGDSKKYDKTTHAFAYGGPAETVKTLNQAMDINVDKFVVINWKTVVDMINAAGGITLNIEDYEIDEMNACTEETARVVGDGKYTKVTKPGKQKVDGYQAVGYGRMRYGVGDDFKRTERMRTVIEVLLNKLKKSDPKTIDKVLKVTMPLIKTNIDKTDILSLVARVPKYKIETSAGFPYYLTGGLIDGVYYVIPDNLEKNVIEFHRRIFGRSNYIPSQKSMTISNRIEALAGSGNYVMDPDVVPPEEPAPDPAETPKEPETRQETNDKPANPVTPDTPGSSSPNPNTNPNPGPPPVPDPGQNPAPDPGGEDQPGNNPSNPAG